MPLRLALALAALAFVSADVDPKDRIADVVIDPLLVLRMREPDRCSGSGSAPLQLEIRQSPVVVVELDCPCIASQIRRDGLLFARVGSRTHSLAVEASDQTGTGDVDSIACGVRPLLARVEEDASEATAIDRGREDAFEASGLTGPARCTCRREPQ